MQGQGQGLVQDQGLVQEQVPKMMLLKIVTKRTIMMTMKSIMMIHTTRMRLLIQN